MDKLARLPKIDIINELSKISKQGFIKSLRANNTGVGYTIEKILGIKENNDAEPDFLFNGIPVELKSQREHTSSNITLFTLEPPRGTKKEFADLKLLKKHGYISGGRKNLYITMQMNNYNPQGFKLDLQVKELLIVHKTEGVIWKYPIEYIFAKIKKKLSHKVLLVTAESKEEDGKEFFHYKKADMYSDVTDKNFIQLVKSCSLVLEFRMHIGIRANGKEWPRNHGTAFRLNLKHLDKLFLKKEKIL